MSERVVFHLLHGSLASSTVPLFVRKLSAFLDKQKFADVWSTYDLALELGVAKRTIQQHQRHPMLCDYWDYAVQDNPTGHKNTITVWGSKKTIATHRRQRDANNHS